jgi:hypothetical protein
MTCHKLIGNLFGLAEMAYIEADNDLNIITWNNGASKLFKYSEQEATSTTLDKLILINKTEMLGCIKPEQITKTIIDENGDNDSGKTGFSGFVIDISETIRAKGALKVAENLNRCIEDLRLEHKSSKVAQYVTLSVEASSIIPNEDISVDDLLLRADVALYEAKETGRNKAVYKPF